MSEGSGRVIGMENKMLTSEQIIDFLISDTAAFIQEREGLDITDNFGDYLEGLISRSQTVLRMMGVDESRIPTDGSC